MRRSLRGPRLVSGLAAVFFVQRIAMAAGVSSLATARVSAAGDAGEVAGRRLVLVTGANRGLGLEVSRRVLAAGDDVILAGRDSKAVHEACDALRTERGGVCTPLHLDVASDVSIHHAAVELAHRFPDRKIDVLVNNAAIYETGWTHEIFRRTMQTNLLGPLNLVEALLDHLADRGRIINVSSEYGQLRELTKSQKRSVTAAASLEDVRALAADAAFRPDDFDADVDDVVTYKLSKALLNRATQLLATDARHVARGIHTSAVCPGWARTRMGGAGAPRSVEDGARSILWLVDHEAMPSGVFVRDGKPLAW